MKQVRVEQEAERDRIIAAGKEEREGSTEDDVKFELRGRVVRASDEHERESRRSYTRRKNSSSKIQTPTKRSRKNVCTNKRQ